MTLTFGSFPSLNCCWAALLIEECVRNGVDTFCMASGSRSAPLTLAVAENPKAKGIMHFDERGAAYYALGLISATRKPCAVITTSGTAAANLFPAVVEASKRKLPLIVLTADRPPELRSTGAHQTIDQVKMFGDYVRWFYEFPCPDAAIVPEFVLTTVDQAVFQARGELSGPVHLNCMYREPLTPVQAKDIPEGYFKNLQRWRKSSTVFTHYNKTPASEIPLNISGIVDQIKHIHHGIIVAGKLADGDRQSVLNLAEKLNWPLFPDISSGLRLGCKHRNVIAYFDQLLLSSKFKNALRPEGVLHLGGRMTSKRWYEFIDEARPQRYIMVLNHPLRNDPLHMVTARVQSDISVFCDEVSRALPAQTNGNPLRRWSAHNTSVDAVISEFLKKRNTLSEVQTARLITELIPEGDCLFSSNSMPIRDLDMYAEGGRGGGGAGANRGASGIDGIIAAAAGFCAGKNRRTTLLIGDLAFLYDLNSLALFKNVKQPVIIVILNNNGGGIFSFLPIHGLTQKYEQCFGTPHNLTFQAAADLFGFKYARPQSADEFASAYKAALHARASSIIEVLNDRTSNLEVHTALQQMIARAIDAQMHKANGDIPWPKKARRPKPQYAGRNAARTRILNTKKQTA